MTITKEECLQQAISLQRGLAEALRKRRTQLGMSQEELSKRSGLCRSYVSDLERGARKVSFINFAVLASALEIEPWQFLMTANALNQSHQNLESKTEQHAPESLLQTNGR